MMKPYVVTGASWIAITTAGQSGSCWLDEEGEGTVGSVEVRIVHSATGEPSAAALTSGKKVYRANGNNDYCEFSADNVDDVWYAKCLNENDQAIIIVDAV